MRYRAFFSYARADDKLANWLHRQLDGYRTPKALIAQEGALGPVPVKLHPIFRDRTDLDARGHIDQRLQEALEDSECLVVLCTPTSAKSQWVNHECETFLHLGREARIFPVIGAGEPNSGDPETECFPPALRGKGLLAADLREIKRPTGQLVGDGREGGRVKLIAGLLGVRLDQLVQREQRRQRRLVGLLAVSAAIFAAVSVAAMVSAGAAKRALEQTVVSRGWDALAQNNTLLTARYALAGLQGNTMIPEEFESLLRASALQLGRPSRPAFQVERTSPEEIESSFLLGEDLLALYFLPGDRTVLYSMRDGRVVTEVSGDLSDSSGDTSGDGRLVALRIGQSLSLIDSTSMTSIWTRTIEGRGEVAFEANTNQLRVGAANYSVENGQLMVSAAPPPF